MKNYFIPAIALAALLNSASGAQPADNEGTNPVQGSNLAQNIEAQLSVSLFGQVYPPSLGGQSVAVFVDLSKNGDAVRNRYYILPYFKPDFTGFATSVESVCEDGVDDNQEVYASLQFEIASKEVNQEIVLLINSELSIGSQQIGPVT